MPLSTSKKLTDFAQQALLEAGLTGWRAEVANDSMSNTRGVARCDPRTRTISISSVMVNRPVREWEDLIQREIAHATTGLLHHRRNGLVRDKPKRLRKALI